MLEGKELLEKAKLLSKKSEDEIAKGCGYVGPSGRILRKSFYRALIEAKGYKIGNGRQGKNGNRASRGRQTEFKTKVHGNGNLLIGHAYTKKLGLEPGQEFKIDLKKEFTSLQRKIGRKATDDDLFSHLMYPKVFQDYLAFRTKFGDVSVLPTTSYFHGLAIGEEISIEIEEVR